MIKGCNVIMASHYDIASLVKCVILIVPANDAHFTRILQENINILKIYKK